VTRSLSIRLLSEVAGTGLLVGIGTGAVVATIGFGPDRFPVLAIAWFFAVTIPVVAFASISGAHLNPVVSLALVADRRLPAGELPGHVGAQVAGAFAGSGAVAALVGTGAHLGATIPSANEPVPIFGAEFAFTFLLVLTVLGLVRWGAGTGRWRLAWPGLAVAVSTLRIGPFTGSSLNPARSLAPAVLSGSYLDLWVYFLAAPLAALAAVGAARLLERSFRGSPPTVEQGRGTTR